MLAQEESLRANGMGGLNSGRIAWLWAKKLMPDHWLGREAIEEGDERKSANGRLCRSILGLLASFMRASIRGLHPCQRHRI